MALDKSQFLIGKSSTCGPFWLAMEGKEGKEGKTRKHYAQIKVSSSRMPRITFQHARTATTPFHGRFWLCCCYSTKLAEIEMFQVQIAAKFGRMTGRKGKRGEKKEGRKEGGREGKEIPRELKGKVSQMQCNMEGFDSKGEVRVPEYCKYKAQHHVK